MEAIKTSKETTIILSAGPINYSNLPVGTTMSNGMISINGKPIIGWILDDLIAKSINQCIIVLRKEDERLRSFVDRTFVGRIEIKFVPVSEGGTIVQSLHAGLSSVDKHSLVRVVLGDTLIRDSFEGKQDFVYVGEVNDSERWCILKSSNGKITQYIDKKETDGDKHTAIAGYYHLLHGSFFDECVTASISVGEDELSDVLRRYGDVFPIEAKQVNHWYDFGHIENLVDAKRRLLQARYFNTLTINPLLNTIFKVSDRDQKLRDELEWYLQLPDNLKALTPRIISSKTVNGHLQIEQEYYGYPTLAELYVFGELHAEMWHSILRKVMNIQNEFSKYRGELSPVEVKSVYIDKTWLRLEALVGQDPEWSSLVNCDEITFNNQTLRGIRLLENDIETFGSALADTSKISIIHGDYCFSNILFDVSNQILRLIDPRGSFGKRGIYGDPRYDIAKLRHSVVSLYDFIISDMFEFHENGSEYFGKIYSTDVVSKITAIFEQIVDTHGHNSDDIKFIEGLLFISMLPLHSGQEKRQKMMFMTGLSLLNEVL